MMQQGLFPDIPVSQDSEIEEPRRTELNDTYQEDTKTPSLFDEKTKAAE